MKRTVSVLIFLILTSFSFSITMNDHGNFVTEDNSENIQLISEDQKIQLDDKVFYFKDNNLYLNDNIIAKLRDFFKIIANRDEVYVVTRNTIFNFSEFDLKPMITFQDQIYDIAYNNGDFHVSLKNSILNGYKFTHNVVSENKKVSRVGFTILKLNKDQSKNTADTSVYKKNQSNVIL
ncbi:MAG: hypothetical protein JXR69_04705 [Candidatus Delongbacteria bacterium]|nr:hypothetical protein [Candidatus Delongbacteria bacterium]